jgi:putative redox protein
VTTRISASVDVEAGKVLAATAAGTTIAIAGDPPEGDGSAPGPKEALLSSLAACAALDVTSILRKKRQGPSSYEVVVTGESDPEPPRVFTSILVEHRVSGDVAPEPLRRSIELSATRYCPVNAMLSAVARIEHRYLLLDASGGVFEATVAVIGPDREVRVIESGA